MNIWNWILNAVLSIVTNIILFLFPNAISAIDFATPLMAGFVVFLKLSYLFFSTFNLFWFGLYLLFVMFFSVVKIVLRIIMFIRETLPWLAKLVGL